MAYLRFLLISLALLVLGLSSGVAHATNFGTENNPRFKQARGGENLRYSAVVMVARSIPVPDMDIPGAISPKATSSGFMVSPCYAMTNYHAVFGGSQTPSSKDFWVTINAKVADGSSYLSATGRPVMWGSLSPEDRSNDWVMLQLDSCIGQQTGWVDLRSSGQGKSAEVYRVAGFPGARDRHYLWVSHPCAIQGRLFDLGKPLAHDCSMGPGDSGGPIYGEAPGQPLQVVAMASGERNARPGTEAQYNPLYANVAVSTDRFLSKVRPLIQADIRQHGNNPILSATR